MQFTMYWVIHLVVHSGLVDLRTFYVFRFCTILLGLMTIWQIGLSSWARRCNFQIKVNSTEVHDQMNHPVFRSYLSHHSRQHLC